MQRTQIPIEADLDNIERLERLKTNEYVLSLLMHHYFSLRLGPDETQGIEPEEALKQTKHWAREMEEALKQTKHWAREMQSCALDSRPMQRGEKPCITTKVFTG